MIFWLVLLSLVLGIVLPLVRCSSSSSSSSDTWKQIQYEVSLGYGYTKHRLLGSTWWNEVLGPPTRLYLGAIPLESHDHHTDLQKLGVRHVLSILEPFELQPAYVLSTVPVTRDTWESLGVAQTLLESPDFGPVKPEIIHQGTQVILDAFSGRDDHIAGTAAVYVHCKAGVGRSATIVAGYLMRTRGWGVKEAHAFLLDKRPQVNLNKYQLESLELYAVQYLGREPGVEQKTTQEGDTLVDSAAQLTEDTLTTLLDRLMDAAISGITASPYVENLSIESIDAKAERYLSQHQGSLQDSLDHAIHPTIQKKASSAMVDALLSLVVPGVGPVVLQEARVLWSHLRQIALIARLHGHDLQLPEVQNKILCVLIGGDLKSIPLHMIHKRVTKEIMGQFFSHTLARRLGAKVVKHMLPVGALYEYVTGQSVQVGTLAHEMFRRLDDEKKLEL